MAKRKLFLDNIRWVTVLLVLFFHVFYYYHAGYYGTGGRFQDRQWQDVFMYLLNPWFMLLLFLVAGVSSNYALTYQKPNEFLKNRTRKLLVPCTIGLVFLQLVTCYFLGRTNGELGVDAKLFDCLRVKHSGPSAFVNLWLRLVGHLWFIVDLWVFSLLILPIRKLEKGRVHARIGRLFAYSENETVLRRVALDALLVVGGWIIVWATTQVNETQTDYLTLRALWNGFHPVNCFAAFLMGYYVFSHDAVQERIARLHIPLLLAAAITGAWFASKYMAMADDLRMQGITNLYKRGSLFASQKALGSVLGSAFVWLTILAMMGCFKAWFDKTNRFAGYMAKSSYGIYVVHYSVIAIVGFCLKNYTPLAPWAKYVILLVSVLLLSPLVYEVIKRIPFVRWCVLGMKKPTSK